LRRKDIEHRFNRLEHFNCFAAFFERSALHILPLSFRHRDPLDAVNVDSAYSAT